MEHMRLLLLSNSTMPGEAFFTWPRQLVKDFLSPHPPTPMKNRARKHVGTMKPSPSPKEKGER